MTLSNHSNVPNIMVHRLPITQIGVWRVWQMSNRLYSRVWFLWLANKSNSSMINTTGWLFLDPAFSDCSKNWSFSSKEPNTMSPTVFSSLSCRVISSNAMLSSVCRRPFRLTCANNQYCLIMVSGTYVILLIPHGKLTSTNHTTCKLKQHRVLRHFTWLKSKQTYLSI